MRPRFRFDLSPKGPLPGSVTPDTPSEDGLVVCPACRGRCRTPVAWNPWNGLEEPMVLIGNRTATCPHCGVVHCSRPRRRDDGTVWQLGADHQFTRAPRRPGASGRPRVAARAVGQTRRRVRRRVRRVQAGPHARFLVREAKARGKLAHCGRVNTRKRIRYAAGVGCDSCDGSGFSRWPDKRIICRPTHPTTHRPCSRLIQAA
jgi:hypothetical protein